MAKISRIPVITAALALFVSTVAAAEGPARRLTDAEMEHFLRNAQIVSTRPIGEGITGSIRATMTDGTLTHDAQIQIVDEFKEQFRTAKGTELNFRDSWRYNVAAYKVDRLLDLRLVPVSVERRWNGYDAAFTWWVDDVMMDERKRMAKQIVAPNYPCWAGHSQALRMFDQLVENTDRNLGNTLIGKNWRIWAIDHTRAFRRSSRPSTTDLKHIDPTLLHALESLEFTALKREIGRYVQDADIRNMLKRRDALVAHYRGLGERALVSRVEPAVGCLAPGTSSATELR